jgi:hypothetical protein
MAHTGRWVHHVVTRCNDITFAYIYSVQHTAWVARNPIHPKHQVLASKPACGRQPPVTAANRTAPSLCIHKRGSLLCVAKSTRASYRNACKSLSYLNACKSSDDEDEDGDDPLALLRTGICFGFCIAEPPSFGPRVPSDKRTMPFFVLSRGTGPPSPAPCQ